MSNIGGKDGRSRVPNISLATRMHNDFLKKQQLYVEAKMGTNMPKSPEKALAEGLIVIQAGENLSDPYREPEVGPVLVDSTAPDQSEQNQQDGVIPVNVGCLESLDCATGYACVNGECEVMSPIGSDQISGAGDCELPDADLPINPCKEEGGCWEPTCGEDVGEEPGEKTCCGGTVYSGYLPSMGVNPLGDPVVIQTWTESCEPLKRECDQYADSWFKSTGELAFGYDDAEMICGSCDECLQGGICVPYSPSFAPCYCNYGVCKDERGPCYDCDFETGDCLETCDGCAAQCNQLFTCNCDPLSQVRQALGSFNPCTDSGCWEATTEFIQDYCKKNFPCKNDDDCIAGCQTLKGSGSYPPCPSGKICSQSGIMRNEETGQTTYFLTACDVKENCGCDAPPDSPLYTPCGPCQICQDGACVADPACGSADPGSYSVYAWDYQKRVWDCTYCDGSTAESKGRECNSGDSHINYFGFGCNPEEPFCDGGSLREIVYQTDGVFAASGGGVGPVVSSCGEGESVTSRKAIGSVTYQLKHPILNNYDGSFLYYLLVTYEEVLTVETGSSFTNVQPSVMYNTFTIERVEYNGSLPGGVPNVPSYYERELPLTGAGIISQQRL